MKVADCAIARVQGGVDLRARSPKKNQFSPTKIAVNLPGS